MNLPTKFLSLLDYEYRAALSGLSYEPASAPALSAPDRDRALHENAGDVLLEVHAHRLPHAARTCHCAAEVGQKLSATNCACLGHFL